MNRTKLIAYLGDFIRDNRLLISSALDHDSGKKVGWFIFGNYSHDELMTLQKAAFDACKEPVNLLIGCHRGEEGRENGPAFITGISYGGPFDPKDDADFKRHVITKSDTKYEIVEAGLSRIYTAGIFLQLDEYMNNCPGCIGPCTDCIFDEISESMQKDPFLLGVNMPANYVDNRPQWLKDEPAPKSCTGCQGLNDCPCFKEF